MTEAPVPAMLKVAGKRFACERCGATVFTPVAENFACNGCGTMYGSGGVPAPPRRWSFTRDQLIRDLARHRPSLRNPESVADAIIGALEDGESSAREGAEDG